MAHRHEGEKNGTEMHGDPCLNRKRILRNGCEFDPLTSSPMDSELPGAAHLGQYLSFPRQLAGGESPPVDSAQVGSSHEIMGGAIRVRHAAPHGS
jgi:hypothetical protein